MCETSEPGAFEHAEETDGGRTAPGVSSTQAIRGRGPLTPRAPSRRGGTPPGCRSLRSGAGFARSPIPGRQRGPGEMSLSVPLTSSGLDHASQFPAKGLNVDAAPQTHTTRACFLFLMSQKLQGLLGHLWTERGSETEPGPWRSRLRGRTRARPSTAQRQTRAQAEHSSAMDQAQTEHGSETELGPGPSPAQWRIRPGLSTARR